ncbi:hypothetical protein ACE3G8_02520 [Vreelandella venusta]
MNQIASCDTRNGKNATKSVSNNLLKTNTNAERVRLWHLNKVIGQHLCPVALPLESMILPRWKDKELRCQLNRHSLSLELRFYFLALADLVSPLQGWKIGFITVNFSESVTQALTDKDKRSKAGAYANRINRRLKYRGVQAHWYGVLEDQKGNLHSHCIIAYHERDESTVKECFKQDTDMVYSGCRLQHRYKQRSRSNSKPQLKSQLFFHTDALGGFELAPIDIGAADYMSKSLEKKSSYMDIGSCRIFVPNQLRSSARSLYEAAWTQQKRLKSNQSKLTGLNCHQSLTYLLKGWKPNVSPADDRLYDEHATEIDDQLAWNEFRNSEPQYDWEYEETDPGVDAYWETKKLAKEKMRERDYENLITAVDWLLKQLELRDALHTELAYEQNMADAELLFRQQRQCHQPRERDYERSVADAEVIQDEPFDPCFATATDLTTKKHDKMALADATIRTSAKVGRKWQHAPSLSQRMSSTALHMSRIDLKLALESRQPQRDTLRYLFSKTSLKRSPSLLAPDRAWRRREELPQLFKGELRHSNTTDPPFLNSG